MEQTVFFFFLFLGISVSICAFVFVIIKLIDSSKESEKFTLWITERGFKDITSYGVEKEKFDIPQAQMFGGLEKFLRNLKMTPALSVNSSQLVRSWLGNSSFKKGVILRGFEGVLQKSKNKVTLLIQTETRGSGKSRRDYHRTIIAIDIPDTQLQMILNSRINNDASSGGNISYYTNEQKYRLEGDFGTFFELYMPDTTQSETLSMLTPDSMLYILKYFTDYDLEISGNRMYLYTYQHLVSAKFDELFLKLDELVKEMRLRSSDTRHEKVTNALVARTATDSATTYRSLKKDFQIMGIVTFAAVFIAQFINHPIAYMIFGVVMVFIFGKLAWDSMVDLSLKRKYKKVIASYK